MLSETISPSNIQWNKSDNIPVTDITKIKSNLSFCFEIHESKEAKGYINSGLIIMHDLANPRSITVIRDVSQPLEFFRQKINQITNLFEKHIGTASSASVIGCDKDVFAKLKSKYDSKAAAFATTASIADDDDVYIKKAEKILFDAKKAKASDIHFVAEDGNVFVKFRIFKELNTHEVITMDEATRLATVFFVTFTLSSETNEGGTGDGAYLSIHLKEGEFTRRHPETGETVSARMVNIGQNKNKLFNLVLRLIDNSKDPKPESFEKLNFSPAACAKLFELNLITRGMILVTGITGSGKSHSVQNMVMLNIARNGGTKKTYLLEQPIERMMNGVTHINVADTMHDGGKQVEKEVDFSLGNVNRLLMRGDPDNIGYGELRDEGTVAAACNGVGSGHLVYGTLHLDTVLGVFARMESFGGNRNVLFRPGFIRMILFQSLIPTTCPHCAINYKIGDAMPPEFSDMQLLRSYKGGRAISMHDIERAESKRKPGESLIRSAQRLNIINSKDAATILADKKIMGIENEDRDFKDRLNAIINLNDSIPADKINIRFRGNGCEKCRLGVNGVQPAVEILTPDKTFLNLMEQNQYERAEHYWITNLKGFTAIEDTYERILTGVFDPRIVERELGMLTENA